MICTGLTAGFDNSASLWRFAWFSRSRAHLIRTGLAFEPLRSNFFTQDFQFKWYHYHAAAFGTLCTWLELVLLLSNIPVFGPYVEMMKRVTSSILKLFAGYFFIFVAFATSFYLLFPSHFEYQSNLVMVVLKVCIIHNRGPKWIGHADNTLSVSNCIYSFIIRFHR